MTDEFAGGRPTWDERHGLVATAPRPSTGFRLTETGPEPPDGQAVENYRSAVLKLARSGKEGTLDEELCTGARRWPRDVDTDLTTARRRFTWAEQLRTLPKQIAKAGDDDQVPEPVGLELSKVPNIKALLQAIQDYHTSKSQWENRPVGAKRSALERQLGQAETELRNSSDPAIAKQIAALKEQSVNAHKRLAHWQQFTDEAGEAIEVKAALDRLSKGILVKGERSRSYRSWWENLVPQIRAKRDAEDQALDQQTIDRLYCEGKVRLQFLQGRAELHATASAEVERAETEVQAIGNEIERLRAAQLLPENMRWSI